MAPARAIADEPDWEELTSLSKLCERAGGAFGVIVIHDVATDGRSSTTATARLSARSTFS